VTHTERVMAAIEFRSPDRLPRWDNLEIFGGFAEKWKQWKGLPDTSPLDYYGIDIEQCMCDEGPFFSESRALGRDGEYEIFRDTWGRVYKHRGDNLSFMEVINTPLDDTSALASLQFEPVDDERRYSKYVEKVAEVRKAGRLAFSKIGGIYNRCQYMRREDRLLMDMAMDDGFCRELFGRTADYLTQIALEELRRSDSWSTGMWVYDDCASSKAPMFSPAMWDEYLLPLYQKMINTLKAAGCCRVFFHSDGNIGPLLDGLIAAGFTGFNPLEPRVGLDLVKLREKYGKKIIFFGGICNTIILPRGDKKEIEAMVRPLIELGREGGLIIGQASVSDDIAPESYDYYMTLLDQHAHYA
jgi:uroporphyrinogen decarboxylase